MRNNLLGTIESWGPLFYVSFDVKINSFSPRWSSIVAFKGNGGVNSNHEHGDRVPQINLNGMRRKLEFSSYVNGSSHSNTMKVEANKWYNIYIEQNYHDRKVSLCVIWN